MTNVTPKKKESVLKTLAIIGFLSIIVFIAWLSVQLVTFLPQAVNSLASLAEGVNQYQQSIIDTKPDQQSFTVTSGTNLINAGETVDLQWDAPRGDGTFTFSYACTEGIAVDVFAESGLTSVACDTSYDIGTTTSLTIKVDSEKRRYAEITYAISFLRDNQNEPAEVGYSAITIVNATIVEPGSLITDNTDSSDEVPSETDAPPMVAGVDTDNETEGETISSPSTPESESTEASAPTVEYVYAIPSSDPAGQTDLAVRFLAVGRIVGDTFFAETVRRGEAGAIQFEVKNTGTRTSEDWTFTLALPGGGTYESTVQQPLKPNERAVLAIGFPARNNVGSSFRFVVEVATDREISSQNNSFTQIVNFSN